MSHLIIFTTVHPWIQEVVEQLKPAEFEVAFLDLADSDRAAVLLPEAEFVVCTALPAEQARLLQKCRLVMHNGVGYDGIATDTLREMGIPVAVTPDMTAEGVAEHVFMFVLALSKQLAPIREAMQRGEWNQYGWRQGSHNVYGKTMGIIGLGRIGSRVAHLAYAFGCRVLYHDIEPKPAALEARYALRRVDFDTVLAEADIVTLHVPLTPLTQGMFGAAQFEKMKPTALFINASRGPTYDMDALYDCLVSGRLAGAGIDVFDPEPPAVHPLFFLPNVLTTPHVASGTVERQYAINRAQFANCQRVLAGLAPENQL